MKIDQLDRIVKESIHSLFAEQPDLLNYTSESHQSEWNLAYHFSNQIRKYFPEYDCDIEIIKTNFSRKRPDIIIHKRNTQNNLIVIEVKRDGPEKEIELDQKKIKECWFAYPLEYKFGITVNLIDKDSSSFNILENKNIIQLVD